MISDSLSRLVAPSSPDKRSQISDIISKYYPQYLIDLLADSGLTVRALGRRETYCDASPEIKKLGVTPDAWPIPPLGICVIAERTIYLRTITVASVTHELGHGLDLALGGDVYYSSVDARIRRAFANARSFVTTYSACGLDEWFAEASRAMVSGNDASSPWPRVSPERLRSFDPTMFEIMSEIFAVPVAA